VESRTEPLSSASHSLVGLAIQRSDYAGFFNRIAQLEPALSGPRGVARQLGQEERARFERAMHTPPLLEMWCIELAQGSRPHRCFAYLADDRRFPMPGMPVDRERRYYTWALARPSPGRSWEILGQLGGISPEAARSIVEQAMQALCSGALEPARETRERWDRFNTALATEQGGCWASIPIEVLDSLDTPRPAPLPPEEEYTDDDDEELAARPNDSPLPEP
jgi:hypothetical protein